MENPGEPERQPGEQTDEPDKRLVSTGVEESAEDDEEQPSLIRATGHTAPFSQNDINPLSDSVTDSEERGIYVREQPH